MKSVLSLSALALFSHAAIADVLIFHGTYTKKIGGSAAETEPKSGGAYFLYDTSNSTYRFITYYHHRKWRLKHQEDGAFGTLKRTTFTQPSGRTLLVLSDAGGNEQGGTYLHYLLKLEGIGSSSPDTEEVGHGFPHTLTGVDTRILGTLTIEGSTFAEQRFTLRYQEAASIAASGEGKTIEDAAQGIRNRLNAQGFDDGID